LISSIFEIWPKSTSIHGWASQFVKATEAPFQKSPSVFPSIARSPVASNCELDSVAVPFTARFSVTEHPPPVLIGVPAHPQFPSVTSFSVLASPSSQVLPATGHGVPTHPQVPSVTSFSVAGFPSLQANPATGHGVPAQLQLPSSTSFSVLASPSSHGVPAAGQEIGVPAQLQFPSSTSFSVFASPSSHGVPAAAHPVSLITVIKLLEIASHAPSLNDVIGAPNVGSASPL